MEILVIGESCNDVYVYGNMNRLAPEAPVPVLQPTQEIQIGGMSMNVLQNLEALGVQAQIITNKNWESITKVRYIDYKTNQMTLRVDSGDDQYGRASLSNVDWSTFQAVIISDYHKGFLTEQDIELIVSSHSNVFLDTKKTLGSWANAARFIKINNFEHQNTKHTLTPDLEERLIITLGSNGCTHKGKNYPVQSVDVKDVCGAGDTFVAALAYHYTQTKDIELAIEFANRCATQVIQKKGTSKININNL